MLQILFCFRYSRIKCRIWRTADFWKSTDYWDRRS